MAKENNGNFKKAFDDLLAPGVAKSDESEDSKKDSAKKSSFTSTDFVSLDNEAAPNRNISTEEAIIPSDMVINGSVNTKSNMKVMGSIVGDVSCDGDITLLGSIQGNIDAGNLTIQQGGLTGDANVRDNISIEQNASLKGNISAKNVCSDASTEGKITAAGSVELKGQAYVQGDIQAAELSVSTGAKIKGMVNINE